MAPVLGPVSARLSPSCLARAGRNRRTVGGRGRPWGFSQSVLFLWIFVVPPFRPVVFGAKVSSAQ